MRCLGLHLLPEIDLVGSPRRSAVAELDSAGALADLRFPDADADVAEAVGEGPGVVAVDAPLVVANETGRRGVEHLLAWCDVPVFPVSATRMRTVFRGMRGVTLLPRIAPDVTAWETFPDLALRMMRWEAQTGGEPMDLADYRTLWLGVRTPRFRPKGPGRADPAGVRDATALLALAVDLAGWTPGASPGDWGTIRDAAAVDAIACAWVARRGLADPSRVMTLAGSGSGATVVPVDANLAGRIEINRDRLRAEGSLPA